MSVSRGIELLNLGLRWRERILENYGIETVRFFAFLPDGSTWQITCGNLPNLFGARVSYAVIGSGQSDNS